MSFSAITYDEPVFRPPAEANSAILQATIGCSWNRCAFCEMYTSKKFRIRKFEDIQSDIKILSEIPRQARKVFLADGNAFVLSANRLLPILDEVNKHFPKLQRISAYALPSDIAGKSLSELQKVRDAGLRLLYIGIESGDDELLKMISKGETFKSTVEGIQKAHEAGIETSVMVLNGLGGQKYSKQHALHSAELINLIQPKFLSTLTLSMPFGQPHFENRFAGEYSPMTIVELAEELKLFLQNIHVEGCIFRSDHVSNNLILKGRLSQDREGMIQKLANAINGTSSEIYPSIPNIL